MYKVFKDDVLICEGTKKEIVYFLKKNYPNIERFKGLRANTTNLVLMFILAFEGFLLSDSEED